MMITKLTLAGVTLAALSACVGSESSAEDAGLNESGGPSGSAPASPSPSASAAAVAFEGTWRSAPISRRDAVETLKAAGLAKAVKDFLALGDAGGVPVPAEGDTGEGLVVSLELEAGQWTALSSLDGSPFEVLDTGGTYVTTGPDTLEYTNLATQVSTLRWTVEDEALAFEWLSGNTVEYEGVPEGVIQRVLYTAEPFHAQAS